MRQMYRIRFLYVLTHMLMSDVLHMWYLVRQTYETRPHMDPHTCERCSPYIISCTQTYGARPSYGPTSNGPTYL